MAEEEYPFYGSERVSGFGKSEASGWSKSEDDSPLPPGVRRMTEAEKRQRGTREMTQDEKEAVKFAAASAMPEAQNPTDGTGTLTLAFAVPGYHSMESEDNPSTASYNDWRLSLGEDGRGYWVAQDAHNKMTKDGAEQCADAVLKRRNDLVDTILRTSPALESSSGPSRSSSTPSLITPNAPRLKSFLSGEGAVYAHYDLSRAQYTGGALPENWVACRSRTNGRIYYLNQKTQESQWDPPDWPIGQDWVVRRSRQTGAVYYVNQRTGRHQWKRPVEATFMEAVKVREEGIMAGIVDAGMSVAEIQYQLDLKAQKDKEEEDGFQPMLGRNHSKQPMLADKSSSRRMNAKKFDGQSTGRNSLSLPALDDRRR